MYSQDYPQARQEPDSSGNQQDATPQEAERGDGQEAQVIECSMTIPAEATLPPLPAEGFNSLSAPEFQLEFSKSASAAKFGLFSQICGSFRRLVKELVNAHFEIESPEQFVSDCERKGIKSYERFTEDLFAPIDRVLSAISSDRRVIRVRSKDVANAASTEELKRLSKDSCMAEAAAFAGMVYGASLLLSGFAGNGVALLAGAAFMVPNFYESLLQRYQRASIEVELQKIAAKRAAQAASPPAESGQ